MSAKRPSTTQDGKASIGTRKAKRGRASELSKPPFPLIMAGQGRNDFMNGLENVVNLLRGRKNIVVLTGAGISVSSGIPDFRSKNVGIYDTLDTEVGLWGCDGIMQAPYPHSASRDSKQLGLNCPEELFDLTFFQEDPRPFYKFAATLYFPNGGTGKRSNDVHRVRPSDTHRLLALLDKNNMLRRCYTQNIDGLEEEAGVSGKKVVHAHGSLAWATCCSCKRKTPRSEMERDILAGRVARCSAIMESNDLDMLSDSQPSSSDIRRVATRLLSRKRLDSESTKQLMRTRNAARQDRLCGGVLKPGITFFGETLNDNVSRCLELDRQKADAIIVIGTSLSVNPISKVISYLRPDIPRILINRSIVHPRHSLLDDEKSLDSQKCEFRTDYVFDAYLLGFCDDVTRALGNMLFPKPYQEGDCSASVTSVKNSMVTEGYLLKSLMDHASDDREGVFLPSDWSSVKVPHDRVFLFPGAEAPSGDHDNSSDVTYREIAHCDSCSIRIEGTIFKCNHCFDFDLCSDCYPIVSKIHVDGKHSFSVENSSL